MLKLCNTDGGLSNLSHWNLPTHKQDSMQKEVLDDVDIVSLKSLQLQLFLLICYRLLLSHNLRQIFLTPTPLEEQDVNMKERVGLGSGDDNDDSANSE